MISILQLPGSCQGGDLCLQLSSPPHQNKSQRNWSGNFTLLCIGTETSFVFQGAHSSSHLIPRWFPIQDQICRASAVEAYVKLHTPHNNNTTALFCTSSCFRRFTGECGQAVWGEILNPFMPVISLQDPRKV